MIMKLSMTINNYQLQFKGDLISPINRATALRRLSALYEESKDALEPLFDGGCYILKESRDREEIERYQVIYTEIGLIVDLLEVPLPRPAMSDFSQSEKENNLDEASNKEVEKDRDREEDDQLSHILKDIKDHLKNRDKKDESINE